MLQKPESVRLPIPQVEGKKDGGHDGETQALTASQREAPSPHLQESPLEDFGAGREEGAAESTLTPKGARALAALALRSSYRRLDRAVAELVQLVLVKDKSPVTRSEMVKYVIET